MHSSKEPAIASHDWSKSSLFLFGTFGRRTPAARRYYRRCNLALGGFVFFCFIAPILRRAVPHLDWATVFVPGILFTYIAWQFRKYLSGLDELERRIQLESIAWTYLTGMALSMVLAGFGFLMGWNLNPAWFMALEPIRGAYLFFGARRF
jgi:hypothetical protein